MADIRELAALIERLTGTDGTHATAIPRLFLHRGTQVREPIHGVYEPAVCIIAQGAKQADDRRCTAALRRRAIPHHLR